MSDSPDLAAVTQVQQQIWSKGDFAMVASIVYNVADDLAEALDLVPDEKVLDVACGSGNAAIAAARYGCDVVGIDYVPALLDRGRRRAEAEGLTIDFLEGDAEAIPYPAASFDAVLSVFGSMFAPNHRQAASELARVAAPGGKIGLITWTPEGFIGQMLKVVATHVPPPAGVASPILWGKEDYLRELFGDQVASLTSTERTFTWRFRSAEAFVDFFRTFYGPTLKAFEAVGEEGSDALFADLIDLIRRFGGTSAGAVSIPSTYLETIAVRA